MPPRLGDAAKVENHLGQNLRNRREKAGLSQSDVSAALGISQQSVARWEGGAAEPSVQMLCRMADFYLCSLDALVGTGRSAMRAERLSPWLRALDRATADRWGFFAVQFPGGGTSWFPVSEWAADFFLVTQAAKRSWIAMPALNNRILLINLKAPLAFHLTRSPPWRNNSPVPWDATEDLTLENYRTLGKWNLEPAEFLSLLSPRAQSRRTVASITVAFRIHQFHAAHYVLADGSHELFRVSGPGLWRAVCDADADDISTVELSHSKHHPRLLLGAAALWGLSLPTVRVLDDAEALQFKSKPDASDEHMRASKVRREPGVT